jgi:hypothetical protein
VKRSSRYRSTSIDWPGALITGDTSMDKGSWRSPHAINLGNIEK